MNFELKKAENCFSDAENYEYRVEVPGSVFLERVRPQTIETHINDKLRRPTFTAQLDSGARVKGLLDKTVIKVGYSPNRAAEQKAAFEHWLSELTV
jgi:hypothetical protein